MRTHHAGHRHSWLGRGCRGVRRFRCSSFPLRRSQAKSAPPLYEGLQLFGDVISIGAELLAGKEDSRGGTAMQGLRMPGQLCPGGPVTGQLAQRCPAAGTAASRTSEGDPCAGDHNYAWHGGGALRPTPLGPKAPGAEAERPQQQHTSRGPSSNVSMRLYGGDYLPRSGPVVSLCPKTDHFPAGKQRHSPAPWRSALPARTAWPAL